MSQNLMSELDKLHNLVRQAVIADIGLENNFLKVCQNVDRMYQYLEASLAEKQNLENALVEMEKQHFIRNDKVNVALQVVQQEKELRKNSMAIRDQAKQEIDLLLPLLPKPLQRECQTKMANRLEMVAAATAITASNTDIDVTTDSTFYTSSTPFSSGVESDISAPRMPKLETKTRTGFTPMRASSLKEICNLDTTFSLTGGEMALTSLTNVTYATLASTFHSEDSRKSAEFFSTILDNLIKREHTIHRKTFCLGEQCIACCSKIACGRRGYVCEDCHCVAHEKCVSEIPKPCIPIGNNVDFKSNAVKSIEEYSPRFGPYIPAVVVHSILQIEERGLQTPGLYKIPIFDHSVDELKHQSNKNRGVPNLKKIDNIHTICQFLKGFFASIKPALILANEFENMCRTFVQEESHGDKIALDKLMDVMFAMQPLNRDTFAFLLLHLQKVAASKECKMSAMRLSRIFTPILVDDYKRVSYAKELRNCKLLEMFIKAPSEYWKIVFVRDV